MILDHQLVNETRLDRAGIPLHHDIWFILEWINPKNLPINFRIGLHRYLHTNNDILSPCTHFDIAPIKVGKITARVIVYGSKDERTHDAKNYGRAKARPS